ncbi:MAG: RHS repeat-associated core domain-containing protein [Xanthomonadales bacterium]|nr:RHS repeat-associated core domain-containing protein [Xanthomonadales bacterium]
MAFETNVLGNLLMRYDHGPDRLLAETEARSTRTWLTDALKTPVKRLTDTGTTYSVTRYDEYGEVEEETSPDIPRFGFTGHQRGPGEAPDLYYAQQRWYNAATGRFISEDPVWGEPKRPLSLHRYLYAYANPTVFVDPDGRMGLPNSWSEMPGYEAPEPCELCYVDGTPERKAAAYAALSAGERAEMAGATVGMLKRAGQVPVNAVMGAAGVVNAGVDALSGGRLYGGSAQKLADGVTSAGNFLANPIDNTRAHFEQIDAEVQFLRNQGRHYEAGVAGAQGAADLVEGSLALSGAGSLGTSLARLSGRAARDGAAQFGREVAGSPTAYYVQESSIGFITELWRPQVKFSASTSPQDLQLRVMTGPNGSVRIRGGEEVDSSQ